MHFYPFDSYNIWKNAQQLHLFLTGSTCVVAAVTTSDLSEMLPHIAMLHNYHLESVGRKHLKRGWAEVQILMIFIVLPKSGGVLPTPQI